MARARALFKHLEDNGTLCLVIADICGSMASGQEDDVSLNRFLCPASLLMIVCVALREIETAR